MRRSRRIEVGGVPVGGGAPVAVQSMTKTDTADVPATLAQIHSLARAGCEIVRVAVPGPEAARALGAIAAQSPLPVVADVHFSAELALRAVDSGVAGVRINPGNIASEEDLRRIGRAAAEQAVAVRVGVNSGSLRPAPGAPPRRGDAASVAEAMCASALWAAGLLEEEGVFHLKLSLKAADVRTTILANRLAAERCDLPLHLGVTAAGPPDVGLVRSAAGLGVLLLDGIGDTVRISLTGPPEEEVRAARELLDCLGLRRMPGIRYVSCPTCGRCRVDLGGALARVREALAGLDVGDRRISVAVMGCDVNGPGEARSCDVGAAGAAGGWVLFEGGKVVGRVDEDEMPGALAELLRGRLLQGGPEGL